MRRATSKSFPARVVASRPGGTACVLPGEWRDGRRADDGLQREDGLYVARGPDRLADVESVLLEASGWPVLGETSALKPEFACSRCQDESRYSIFLAFQDPPCACSRHSPQGAAQGSATIPASGGDRLHRFQSPIGLLHDGRHNARGVH